MFYPYSVFLTLIVAMSRQNVSLNYSGAWRRVDSRHNEPPAPTLLTCFDTNMGKRSIMQFFVVEFCEL